MAAYDPGVDNLQAFSSLLEATNHVFEAAIPDLGEWGKDLIEAEPDLRAALTSLKTDTASLQKEVETLEVQVTGAAAELSSATHRAIETRMPAIESEVRESRSRSHETLTQRAAALPSELDELQTRGFEPFQAVVTQEQADFERWANEADTALRSLWEGLEAAAEETTRDTEQATADLTAAAEAAGSEHAALDEVQRVELYRLGTNLPDEIEKRSAEASASASQRIEEWANTMKTEVTALHNDVEDLGKGAGGAIQEENRGVTEVLDAAGLALGQAGTEFEQSGADAESLESEAASIADLRPNIETADGEVAEIRALMEALS